MVVVRQEICFRDLGFPLQVQEISQYCPLRLHSHESFIEIVLVTFGRGVHIIDGCRQPISAGDLLVIPSESVHTYENLGDLRYYNILMVPEKLAIPWDELKKYPGSDMIFGKTASDGKFLSFCHLNQETFETARAMASKLHITLARQMPGYHFLALAQLGMLLAFLCDSFAKFRNENQPSNPRRLQILVDEMEEHFDRHFSIEQLCRKAHTSRSSLYEEFKLCYNMAPMEYLMRIRLRQSMNLLQHSTLSIGEIASRCGFCDHSYFTKQFCHYIKMTPLEFRRGKHTVASSPLVALTTESDMVNS